MKRCLASIVALMLVCAARADTTEPIRVVASMVGSMRPGQTATITWTVIGTDEPTRLTLTNTNYESAVLDGGNVQTVTTSGGRKNVVSRKVVGLAPGAFSVDVQIDTEHKALNPQGLALQLRHELLRIASQTRKASRRLLANSMVATADVIAVLDQALEDLDRSLPYPELAAFRDAAAAFVEEIRRDAIEQSGVRRERRDAVFLVHQGTSPAGRISASKAQSLLSPIHRVADQRRKPVAGTESLRRHATDRGERRALSIKFSFRTQ